MRVGVPRETTSQEHRVALSPATVRALVQHGHAVLVEQGSGAAAGWSDDAWIGAGAEIVPTAEEVWARAELLCKVEAPVPAELALVREGQIVGAFHHLASRPELEGTLRDRRARPMAWEALVQAGRRVALEPMSQIAGRLAVQIGGDCLSAHRGGRGVLLGGLPGVPPASVLVIGGGTVGRNAAAAAGAAGADVTVIEVDLEVLRWLDERFGGRVRTLLANPIDLEDALARADLVIGAAALPGQGAPAVLDRSHLALMKPGAAIVDVAVDRGGNAATTLPTTHADPVRVVDTVLHVGIPNLAGSVPRTASHALANALHRAVLALADLGVDGAAASDPGIAAAVVRG